jgi:hypothetical protein
MVHFHNVMCIVSLLYITLLLNLTASVSYNYDFQTHTHNVYVSCHNKDRTLHFRIINGNLTIRKSIFCKNTEAKGFSFAFPLVESRVSVVYKKDTKFYKKTYKFNSPILNNKSLSYNFHPTKIHFLFNYLFIIASIVLGFFIFNFLTIYKKTFAIIWCFISLLGGYFFINHLEIYISTQKRLYLKACWEKIRPLQPSQASNTSIH